MTTRTTRYLLTIILLLSASTLLFGCSSRTIGIENTKANSNCIKVMNVQNSDAFEIAYAVSQDVFEVFGTNSLRNKVKVRGYSVVHGQARADIIPRLIHARNNRANAGFAYEVVSDTILPVPAIYTGFMATSFFDELAEYIEQENIQTHTICDYIIAKSKGNITVGSGTCWLVDQRGYHVTCAHVVGLNKKVLVVLPNGSEIQGKVVLRDPNNDIAIIKTQPLSEKYLPVPVKKTGYVEVGEEIFVIGYPMPFTTSSGLKIAPGLVSSQLGLHNDASEYQLSAVVNGGNSGGPVIDSTGQAIAIASSKLVITGVEGTAYAKKSNLLPLFFKQLGINNPEAGNANYNAKDLHKHYKHSVFRVKSF